MLRAIAVGLGIGAGLAVACDASAQHVHASATADTVSDAAQRGTGVHEMWMTPVGDWMLMGMGQFFPMFTVGAPGESGSPLRRTGWYLSQPVIMGNVESRGARVVLRTTVNFEAITQADGELTFGGWGEGFIDSRHPHAMLHEAMLSVNVWDAGPGALSFSAGRGFAPYGTDDPMSRPVTKYPTNHHLSQILERWTLKGVYAVGRWSVEAGLFGGQEPTSPYDMSNISSFGDSYSGRIAFRPGGDPAMPPWEISASAGRVREEHGAHETHTTLINAAIRHDHTHSSGRTVYALLEASRSNNDSDDSYFSVLAEGQVQSGIHRPYLRVEYATRPEYEREGPAGSDGFFRYDHDGEVIGATRWLITTLGYGIRATDLPFSMRPFIEVQHHRVSHERGPAALDPTELFGTDSFFALSAGVRVFLGGGSMRMGTYGVLDPMTGAHRGGDRGSAEAAPHHH